LIEEAARCVQTAGLVLPVATVALVAMIPMAPIPTSAGASRQILPDLIGCIADL
jgi:hypothetical protein